MHVTPLAQQYRVLREVFSFENVVLLRSPTRFLFVRKSSVHVSINLNCLVHAAHDSEPRAPVICLQRLSICGGPLIAHVNAVKGCVQVEVQGSPIEFSADLPDATEDDRPHVQSLASHLEVCLAVRLAVWTLVLI